MKKIGFTIGKFAPLHKGHQFLIETALKERIALKEVIKKIEGTDIEKLLKEYNVIKKNKLDVWRYIFYE